MKNALNNLLCFSSVCQNALHFAIYYSLLMLVYFTNTKVAEMHKWQIHQLIRPNLHNKPHSASSLMGHSLNVPRLNWPSSKCTSLNKYNAQCVWGRGETQISHCAKIIRAATGINAIWKIRTSFHCLKPNSSSAQDQSILISSMGQ